MGTIIVLFIVIGVVALALKSIMNDKKKGKSIQCGHSCESCGGHCK